MPPCSEGDVRELFQLRQQLDRLAFELYDYDAVSTPAHYGRIRAELERRGTTVGGMDLLIAAHALGLNATVVTNNVSHFSRIPGLHLVNWLKHSPTA